MPLTFCRNSEIPKKVENNIGIHTQALVRHFRPFGNDKGEQSPLPPNKNSPNCFALFLQSTQTLRNEAPSKIIPNYSTTIKGFSKIRSTY